MADFFFLFLSFFTRSETRRGGKIQETLRFTRNHKQTAAFVFVSSGTKV